MGKPNIIYRLKSFSIDKEPETVYFCNYNFDFFIDIVYIYIGRPYSEIRYKCRVINDCVSEELLQANSYAISKIKSNNYYSKKEKYMQLECVCEYPEGFLTLEKLRDHGLGQVQIQARADRKVRAFLTDTDTLHAAGGVL